MGFSICIIFTLTIGALGYFSLLRINRNAEQLENLNYLAGEMRDMVANRDKSFVSFRDKDFMDGMKDARGRTNGGYHFVKEMKTLFDDNEIVKDTIDKYLRLYDNGAEDLTELTKEKGKYIKPARNK